MTERYESSERYVEINVKVSKSVSAKKIEKIRAIIDEAYDKIYIQTGVFRKPHLEIPEMLNGKENQNDKS